MARDARHLVWAGRDGVEPMAVAVSLPLPASTCGRLARELVLAAALAVVLAGGTVHGVWTHRWGGWPAVDRAVGGLDRVPVQVGDWRAQPIDVPSAELLGPGVASCLARRYENQRTGQAVSVFLFCGPPGPLAVHTPDVCYPGAGYDLVSDVGRCAAAPGDRLFTARFRKPGPVEPTYLRVFWGWSAGAGWKAEDNPLLAFARAPVLYKLYAVRPLPDAEAAADADPTVDLLRHLLPATDTALFANP